MLSRNVTGLCSLGLPGEKTGATAGGRIRPMIGERSRRRDGGIAWQRDGKDLEVMLIGIRLQRVFFFSREFSW